VSAIEFTGRLARRDSGQQIVRVDVELRGESVGTLELNLDQWDQLRDDAKSLDRIGYVHVISNDAKIAARFG
jgi:hypothetical protein